MDFFSYILNFLVNFWHTYGGSIFFSSALIVGGRVALKMLNPILEKAFTKINMKDRFIVGMVKKLVQISLWIFITGLVLNSFKISISSVLLSMSPLFLIIGLGFKSFINNFIKGIQLKILNPYEVGDEIEVDGVRGIVEQVDFFYTYLNTTDGGFTTIANSQVADKKICNFTHNNKGKVITPSVDEVKMEKATFKEKEQTN